MSKLSTAIYQPTIDQIPVHRKISLMVNIKTSWLFTNSPYGKSITTNNVPVNSNCDYPPWANPGNLTFQKNFGQIPQGAGKKHGQMPLRPGQISMTVYI
jgi:hypothetical protein